MKRYSIVIALLAVASIANAQEKEPLRGLVSMGAYKFVVRAEDPNNTFEPINKKPGIFGGIVILASWRELQQSASSPLAENNTIDKALEEVRAYDKRNPQKPLGVKLRVWGGFVAPDWAKSLGGGAPIQVVHKKPRTVGRFWGPPYRKHWAHLQEMLAVKYDKEPLIREVAMTSCMSFTAEPFFLPGEETVKGPLEKAGFKPAEFKRCLMDGLEDYAVWKSTNIETPLNPIHMPLGNPKGDQEFTAQYMRECRKAFGKRCIFDNHDLDTTPAKAVLPVYAEMKKMGGPIEFQTGPATPKDFEGTIKYGAEIGAGSIELYQDFGGFPLVPDPKLKRWAAILEGNRGR
jgi:hypothetical protein